MFVVSCSAGATCAYMDYISLLSDADDSDSDAELQEALHASLRSKITARPLCLYFVCGLQIVSLSVIIIVCA